MTRTRFTYAAWAALLAGSLALSACGGDQPQAPGSYGSNTGNAGGGATTGGITTPGPQSGGTTAGSSQSGATLGSSTPGRPSPTGAAGGGPVGGAGTLAGNGTPQPIGTGTTTR